MGLLDTVGGFIGRLYGGTSQASAAPVDQLVVDTGSGVVVVNQPKRAPQTMPQEPELSLQRRAAFTPSAPRTPTDLDQLTEGILSNFTPNILGSFDQPTYNFKLFMAPDIDLQPTTSALGSAALAQALENQRRVILAESGVTGLNIRDVSIENVVGPNFTTRNTNTSKITITITEPMGTSFMDLIVKSVSELGIGNYNKAPYYLELSFRGYDQAGSETTNLCAAKPDEFPNGGIWIWQIAINNIETDFSQAGTVYTITAIPYNETAFDQEMQWLPESITITADTVGKLFKEVKDAVNAVIKDTYADFQLWSIDFKLWPITTEKGTYDLTAFSLISTNPSIDDRRNNNYFEADGNKVCAHFARGTTILDLVEMTYSNTQEGKALISDVDPTDGVALTAKKFRECFTFRVEPEIKLIGFDDVTQQYQKEIIFHVFAYPTQLPILSEDQIEKARDRTTQMAMVARMKEKGFMRKQYEYLFTGMNTEIISVDLKYNMKWNAVLPRFLGVMSDYHKQVAVGAKLAQDRYWTDEYRRLSQRRRNLMMAITALKRIEAGIARDKLSRDEQQALESEEQTGLKVDKSKLQQQIAQLRAQAADFEDARKLLKPRFTALREQSAAADAKRRTANPGDRPVAAQYAEELRTAVIDADQFHFPISILENSEDSINQTTGALNSHHNRNKNIFGSVLDQLYGPMTQQMMHISLEVRGDPYWLGPSNMDRRLDLATNNTVMKGFANYVLGDNFFVLTFRYPEHLDEYGSPFFNTAEVNNPLVPESRTQDTFNGIYVVRRVTHSFSGGVFKQTLDAYRMPLIEIFKSIGIR